MNAKARTRAFKGYRKRCSIFASKVSIVSCCYSELTVLGRGIVDTTTIYIYIYNPCAGRSRDVTRHMLMIRLFLCFSGHCLKYGEGHILCKCARLSQSLNGYNQSPEIVFTPSTNLDSSLQIALILLIL